MVLTFAIKSAIILTMFYVCMKPMLGKETFHRLNRILAVGSMLLSLLIPLLHVEIACDAAVVSRVMSPQLIEFPADITTVISAKGSNAQLGYDWVAIVTLFYLGGTGIVALFLSVQTCRLLCCLRKGIRVGDGRGNTIILLRGKISPFCFFHNIVMGVEDYEKNRYFILAHEQEHIRLQHHLDLLLLAVTCVVQWFNPFVWLLGKKLKMLHEYEVDEAVVNQGVDTVQYQKFLVVKAAGSRLQLFANNLHQGSLKSRIIMMNQKKSSKWMALKALTLVPAAALAVSVFATESVIPSVKNVAQHPHAKKILMADRKIYAGNASVSSTVVLAKYSVPQRRSTPKKKVEDTLPEFPGGVSAMMDFLRNNAKYPEAAKNDKNEGKCVIRFLVRKDGSIDEVSVAKTTGFENLDDEAVRVVKSMPRWNPGTQNGKPVDVSYMAPLVFRLD